MNIFGDKQIKVIRHAGDLNSVVLEDGVTVKRASTIAINEELGNVKTAPYDNHFIFYHVFAGRGWSTWCTCGSPAGVVGYDAYSNLASNSGQMCICLHHSLYGKHADGSS